MRLILTNSSLVFANEESISEKTLTHEDLVGFEGQALAEDLSNGCYRSLTTDNLGTGGDERPYGAGAAKTDDIYIKGFKHFEYNGVPMSNSSASTTIILFLNEQKETIGYYAQHGKNEIDLTSDKIIDVAPYSTTVTTRQITGNIPSGSYYCVCYTTLKNLSDNRFNVKFTK